VSFWAVFKAAIAAYLGYVAAGVALMMLILVGAVVAAVVSSFRERRR